jgi:hypothetical protein
MTDTDGCFHSSVMNIDNYAIRINTTGSSEQCNVPVKKGNARFFTNTIEVVGRVKDNVPKGDVNANTSFVPLSKRSYIESDDISTEHKSEPRKSSSKLCQDSGLPSLLVSRCVGRGSILKDGFEEPVPEDAHEVDSSDMTNEESTSEESTSEESTSEESSSSSSEDDDLSDPEPVISRCKKSEQSRFPVLRLEDNDAESDSDSSSARLDDEIFDSLRRVFSETLSRT